MKRLFAAMMMTGLMCTPMTIAQDKKTDKPAASSPAQPPKDGGKKDAKPDMMEMGAAMEEAAKPGPYHDWLKSLEGKWVAEVKEMMNPAGGSSKGEQNNEMILGGRFLRTTYSGKMEGKAFNGNGTMGYNNVDKRFECVWIDTMGTGINMTTGQASKDGKVLTMNGEMSTPDGSKMKFQEVTTILSKDSYKFEWKGDMGGSMTTMLEINYTRAPKGEAKHDDHKDHKHDDKKEEKKDDKKGK